MIDKDNVIRILELDSEIDDDDLQDEVDEYLLKLKNELVTKPPIIKLLKSKIKRLNLFLLQNNKIQPIELDYNEVFNFDKDYVSFIKQYQKNTSLVKLKIHQSQSINDLIKAINLYIETQHGYNHFLNELIKDKVIVEDDHVKASDAIDDLFLLKYFNAKISIADQLLLNKEFFKIKKRLQIERG